MAISALLCFIALSLWPSDAHADTTFRAYERGIHRLVMGYIDGNGETHTWNESIRAVDEDADGVNISTVAYCADLWTSPPPTGEVRRGNLLELYPQDVITKMALVCLFVDQHDDIFYDDTYDESFRLFFRQMAFWKIQNMDNGKLQDTFLDNPGRFGMTKSQVDALYDQALAFIGNPENLEKYTGHGYAYYGPAGTQTLMKVWYERKPVIEITKTVNGGQVLPGQSLAGAEYSVYSNASLTNKIETIVIGSDGKGRGKVHYDTGAYYVKETKAPASFTLDGTVHKIEIKTGKTTATTSLRVKDYPKGKISVRKSSSVPATTDGNPCYSLGGATFDVFDDSALSRRVGTITTDESGYGESDFLDASSGATPGKKYYVREQQSSRGTNYAWNDKVYEVIALPGKVVAAGDDGTIGNTPQVDDIGVFLQKIDIETGAAVAQGDATLAGARFMVEYFASLDEVPAGSPMRTWMFTTDASGRLDLQAPDVEGDALFKALDGRTNVFPVGTYRITEIEAPAGYLLPSEDRHDENDGPWIVRVTGDPATPDETIATFNGGDEPVIQREQVIRGDLELVKTTESDMARLAKTPFILKSNTTGEMHVVVSDENGHISTSSDWNAHTTNTNGNDPDGANEGRCGHISNGAIEIAEDGTWVVTDETKLDTASGVWFGLDTAGNWTGRQSDEEGALPYDGTYELIELPCSANEGLKMVDIHNITVRRDGKIVDMGTIDDKEGPSIRTQARDATSSTNEGTLSTSCTLIDEVAFDNLEENVGYTLEGTLMDTVSGEALIVDGKPVKGSTSFSPRFPFGTIDVMFDFDSSGLQGRKVVVFEKLIEAASGEVIASHEDLGDEGQSIEFPPEIWTSAADALDGDGHVSCEGIQRIVDTVTYRGLKAGEEYTVRGMLVDQESGAPLLDTEGMCITGSTTFTPETPSGAVEVAIDLDASALEGKTAVVFESLLLDEKTICVHADLGDEGQTIRFPVVATAARDAHDGDSFLGTAEDAVIVDTVSYSGLEPGVKHRMKATLMNAMTGEAIVLDDAPVTAQVDFVPEESSGEVDVEIPVDTRGYAGMRLIVFEKLVLVEEEGEKVLAVHEDIENENQTVTIPAVQTKALDKRDGDKTIASEGELEITDSVSYEGLLPGRTYMIEGILMDKGTGKALVIDGRRVTAARTFAADTPAGSIDMEFSFTTNGLPANRELVVFETIFHNDKAIATHCDLEDGEQTVTVENRPIVHTPGRLEPLPKTGDGMKMVLVALAMLGVGGGAAAILGLRRKHRAPE